MSDDAQKQREREAERRERFKFLDRRIPELHAMGKPEAVIDPETGKQLPRTGGTFPGVKARIQAMREWANGSR